MGLGWTHGRLTGAGVARLDSVGRQGRACAKIQRPKSRMLSEPQNRSLWLVCRVRAVPGAWISAARGGCIPFLAFSRCLKQLLLVRCPPLALQEKSKEATYIRPGLDLCTGELGPPAGAWQSCPSAYHRPFCSGHGPLQEVPGFAPRPAPASSHSQNDPQSVFFKAANKLLRLLGEM